MTELIVALDGPCALGLGLALHCEAGVRWLKMGPQAMAQPGWHAVVTAGNRMPRSDYRIFLDLKLHDTSDTVREAVKRFADAGISAVSTYGSDSTIAALEGADGTNLQVWQWVWSSAETLDRLPPAISYCLGAHGLIGPASVLRSIGTAYGVSVVPGVRLFGEPGHGHASVTTTDEIAGLDDYFAVVGRPIYDATDPVARALLYREALR